MVRRVSVGPRRTALQNGIQRANQLRLVYLSFRMADPILHAMRRLLKQNEAMRNTYLLEPFLINSESRDTKTSWSSCAGAIRLS